MFWICYIEGRQKNPWFGRGNAIGAILPRLILAIHLLVCQAVEMKGGIGDPFEIRVPLIAKTFLEETKQWVQDERYYHDDETQDVREEQRKEIK